MKTVLAKLPDFIGLSGVTIGITNLQQSTILNNGGIPQPFINTSGSIFAADIVENLTGWYDSNVYHNGNEIAFGSVRLESGSGPFYIGDSISSTVVVVPAASLPSVSGNTISVFKGTNWNINISGVGDTANEFYFTLKRNASISDENCTLQLNTSGVKYFNQVPQNNVSGVLNYTDDVINVSVNPTLTSQIQPGKYSWDIKGVDTDVSIRSFGFWNVKEDITDAIS